MMVKDIMAVPTYQFPLWKANIDLLSKWGVRQTLNNKYQSISLWYLQNLKAREATYKPIIANTDIPAISFNIGFLCPKHNNKLLSMQHIVDITGINFNVIRKAFTIIYLRILWLHQKKGRLCWHSPYARVWRL